MLMILFKILIGLIIFCVILGIFSVLITFFKAAWDSVTEDELKNKMG